MATPDAADLKIIAALFGLFVVCCIWLWAESHIWPIPDIRDRPREIIKLRFELIADSGDVVENVTRQTPSVAKTDIGADKMKSSHDSVARKSVLKISCPGSRAFPPFTYYGSPPFTYEIELVQNDSKSACCRREESHNSTSDNVQLFNREVTAGLRELSQSAIPLLANLLQTISQVSTGSATEKKPVVAVDATPAKAKSEEVTAIERKSSELEPEQVSDLPSPNSCSRCLEQNDVDCLAVASVSAEQVVRTTGSDDGWMDLAAQ